MSVETPDFYLEQTSYTAIRDKYAPLYASLPDSVEEMCRLIKCQLLHPSMMKELAGQLPPGRRCEDDVYVTASEILGGLVRRNPAGLVFERTPAERLILTCRHHAVLLASMLRAKEIPARVRVGFCAYVSAPNSLLHTDHWICEVWNALESRWMFVDPDISRVDFPRDEFELAGAVWKRARKRKVDPKLYGAGNRTGIALIRANLIHDFDCLLGGEEMYQEGPPLLRLKAKEIGDRVLNLLDEMAEATAGAVDVERLRVLREGYAELAYPDLT